MRLIRTIILSLSLVLVLQAREQVNINFSGLKIDDLIKLISKVTNKNILVNNKISGTVDFVSTTPVYDDELIGILVAVLESKGYTLVKDGSLYKIIRSTNAAKNNVKVANQGQKLYGSLMTTQAIKVENDNVDIVAAKIRYLISKTAKLMTMKSNNTILLTDYPKNIETVKRVIKNISTSSKKIVKIIQIKHTEAKKLQMRLNAIAKSIFNSSVAEKIVNIMLDDSTNSLIIVGVSENVKKIEDLALKLDVESNANERVQIFTLNNADSKSVLKSLNAIISKQTYTDPSLKPNISQSEEINAIIAVGDQNVIKGIKSIIDELDKEKYQVYIKARIMNINKSDAKSIGIKYGFAGGDVSSSGLYAMSANFGDATLTSVASSEVLSFLGGIGSGAQSAFALGATLDFLASKGASKSVSNPSILCVNNKASSIYVGKTISVSSGSTTGTAGTTASFKREDVGLTLKIKPRVSSTQKVTIEVEAILENVLDDGTNSPSGQPTTSKQEIKTQAILRNGESIIIGGLVKTSGLNSVSKVPLLGDIPLVGKYLFSSNSNTIQEDNLVVILTPYIVDNSDKLSSLQQHLGKLSKLQIEYDKEIFKKIEARANSEEKETEEADDNVQLIKGVEY